MDTDYMLQAFGTCSIFMFLELFHETAVATAAVVHYLAVCCCHIVVTLCNDLL